MILGTTIIILEVYIMFVVVVCFFSQQEKMTHHSLRVQQEFSQQLVRWLSQIKGPQISHKTAYNWIIEQLTTTN